VRIDAFDQMARLYCVKAASRRLPGHVFYDDILDISFISRVGSLMSASARAVVPKLIRAVTQIKVAIMSYYAQYFVS